MVSIILVNFYLYDIFIAKALQLADLALTLTMH